MPAHRADVIAQEIGDKLGRRQGLCLIKDTEVNCEACTWRLAHGLGRHGASKAELFIQPGMVTIAATGSAVQPAEIVHSIV